MAFDAQAPSPFGIAALTTAARLAFAAVLLPWFLFSAATKLSGTGLSMGPDVAGTWLSLGAFFQLVPQQIAAAGNDPAALSWGTHLFVHVMVLAEVMLPVLLVLGLATRGAAGGLIGLIAITTLIDVFGRNAPSYAIGRWFDANPYDEILDLRLLWIMLVAIPLTLGSGPIALDALIRETRRKRRPKEE